MRIEITENQLKKIAYNLQVPKSTNDDFMSQAKLAIRFARLMDNDFNVIIKIHNRLLEYAEQHGDGSCIEQLEEMAQICPDSRYYEGYQSAAHLESCDLCDRLFPKDDLTDGICYICRQ